MAPRTRRGGAARGRGVSQDERETPRTEPEVRTARVETPSTETATGSAGPAGAPAVATTAPAAEQVMGDLLRSIQSLTAVMGQREAVSTAPVRPVGRSEVSTAQALRDFLRLSPPAFHGEPDPIVAEEWLQQITRDLDTSEITDGRLRVSFAVRQLKGDAYHWWGRVQTRVGEDFEEFSELFLENYFPESARDARHMQFLELQQGTMSVPEYEARFTALARFAPDLVRTEASRCKRFEKGLRPEIYRWILAHRIRVYSEMVDTAAAVEDGMPNTWEVSGSEIEATELHESGGVARLQEASIFELLTTGVRERRA